MSDFLNSCKDSDAEALKCSDDVHFAAFQDDEELRRAAEVEMEKVRAENMAAGAKV